MAGDIHAITNLSHLSLAGGLGVSSDLSLDGGAISMTSLGRVTLGSGTSLHLGSGSTLAVLAGAQASWHTIAAHSSLASVAGTGMYMGVIFRASGLSLLFRSQNTVYYINSDASGAA